MDHRKWLQDEFGERRRRNRQYSLRAYAKHLGVSPATLSCILAGERPVTLATAVKISESCNLTEGEKRRFLAPLVPKRDGQELYQSQAAAAFSPMSDWHYYAILGLSYLEDCKADHRWIAARLNIPVPVARKAFKDLLRLGVITLSGSGFTQTKKQLTTSGDPDENVRKHHRQLTAKGLEALDSVPVERRDFSSMTMSINPDRMPEARAMIREFRRGLCRFVGKGTQKEVYSLTIGFFPLSRS